MALTITQTSKLFYFFILIYFSFIGASQADEQANSCPDPLTPEYGFPVAFHEAYKNRFKIGMAVTNSDLMNHSCVLFLSQSFNSFTAESDMKWSSVQPKEGFFDFDFSDRFVKLGESNNAHLVGHALIWHRSLPEWVGKKKSGEIVDKEGLLARMESHINAYVGRYKGKIEAWDVVNEAFEDSGEYRRSLWFDVLGEEFIDKAFEYAHKADPEAELYYNDFGVVYERKLKSIVEMIKRLKGKNIPIHGVGIQGHYNMNHPELETLEKTIKTLASLDVKVMITELEISALPFPTFEERQSIQSITGARTEELNPYGVSKVQENYDAHEARYLALFKLFIEHHDIIDRVTIWGISDENSWRNNFPIEGRTDFPLLFDRLNKPKPLVKKLIELEN